MARDFGRTSAAGAKAKRANASIWSAVQARLRASERPPEATAIMKPAQIAPPAPKSDSKQRGILLPVFGLLLSVALLMAMLLVGVANRVGERARAQAAADAVALAGAAEGRGAAVIIAEANDVSLVRFEQDGSGVTVEVAFDGVRAVAAAERQIRPSP